MDDIINFLQNEPVVLVLLAVLTVTLALFITLPAFYDRLKTIRSPTLPSSAKPSKEEKKEPRFKLQLSSKKVRLLVPIAIVVAIVAIGGGYLAYDFFFQPVRIVTASQFKFLESENISLRQSNEYSEVEKSTIRFLDVRSSEEYAKGHIKNSANMLPEQIPAYVYYPAESVSVAVFSSEGDTSNPQKAAKAILNIVEQREGKDYELGRIYIIKDGYEGLKDAGLITEVGVYD